MDNIKNIFNEYVNAYKLLDIKDKRGEVVKKLKEMIVIFQQICEDSNIKYDLLTSREILDLEKEPVSEDDYLEAVFVYTNVLRELMGAVLGKIILNENS